MSSPDTEEIKANLGRTRQAINAAKPWPESQPQRHLHVQASFPAEHATPAGYLDGRPVSEEAQRCLGNDNAASRPRRFDSLIPYPWVQEGIEQVDK